MEHPHDPQDDENHRKQIQKQRNLVLALVLLGFVALFYAITFVRMG